MCNCGGQCSNHWASLQNCVTVKSASQALLCWNSSTFPSIPVRCECSSKSQSIVNSPSKYTPFSDVRHDAFKVKGDKNMQTDAKFSDGRCASNMGISCLFWLLFLSWGKGRANSSSTFKVFVGDWSHIQVPSDIRSVALKETVTAPVLFTARDRV